MGSSDSESEAKDGGVSRFPDYRRSIPLSSVKNGYRLFSKHAATFVLVPLTSALLGQLWHALSSGALHELYEDASQRHLKLHLVTFITCACLLSIVLASLFIFRRNPVYILNFSCYKPPTDMKVTVDIFRSGTRACKAFTEESIEFQERILARAGLGEETYLPHAVRMVPPAISMENARNEAEMVMFGAVSDVLQKTGVAPSEVGVLVVNCSLFNPTPSLAAMIIHHFKLRHDVVHYNLGGMGCSAGLISLDLAAKMLQVHSGQYALVVSTENITQNWYFGNQRSMLIPNTIFRMGCSAVMLSNRRLDWWRAKYQLVCPIVRTITGGQNDAAYHCVYQMEDKEGKVGVKLTKELMGEAGRALKQNITTLGPLVLPWSEQFLFFLNLIGRKVLGKRKVKPYIPDFTLAFDHFCIHTGGRAVIEEIEKQLALPEALVAPSKNTLFRYGNTSSSSLWYILANIETTKGVRRGEKIWQIGFGSGFKCNSSVLRAMRYINEQHPAWTDEEMETDPKWSDPCTWSIKQAATQQNGATSSAAAPHHDGGADAQVSSLRAGRRPGVQAG